MLRSRSTRLVQKWVLAGVGKRDKLEIRSGLSGQKRALSTQPALKGREPRTLRVEPPKGAGSPDSQHPNTHGGEEGEGEGAPSALRRVGVSGGSAGRALPHELTEAGGHGAVTVLLPGCGFRVRREERPRSGRGTCETPEDSPAAPAQPADTHRAKDRYVALLPSLRFPKGKETQASCRLAIRGHREGALRSGESRWERNSLDAQAALAWGLPQTG